MATRGRRWVGSAVSAAALRNARRRPAGLLEQANEANRALHQQFGGERFVTGQLLRLDVRARTGAVVNAGHPLPRRIRGGRVEPVELEADLPLGVDPGAVYQVQQLALEPGDRLMLLSDGALEAAPAGGPAYGAARLDAVLLADRELPPYELVRRVIKEIIAHRAGELADDVTVVCLDWRGLAS